MRVLLFGASGGIGSEVRERARADGHELVLFVRDGSKVEPLQAGESLIEGDIASEEQVARAVVGVDAVVSALGPTSNTPDQVRLFESFARTLVEATGANGARRLVVEAKQRELDTIAASDRDWVAPRPPRVVQGASRAATTPVTSCAAGASPRPTWPTSWSANWRMTRTSAKPHTSAPDRRGEPT